MLTFLMSFPLLLVFAKDLFSFVSITAGTPFAAAVEILKLFESIVLVCSCLLIKYNVVDFLHQRMPTEPKQCCFLMNICANGIGPCRGSVSEKGRRPTNNAQKNLILFHIPIVSEELVLTHDILVSAILHSSTLRRPMFSM